MTKIPIEFVMSISKEIIEVSALLPDSREDRVSDGSQRKLSSDTPVTAMRQLCGLPVLLL